MTANLRAENQQAHTISCRRWRSWQQTTPLPARLCRACHQIPIGTQQGAMLSRSVGQRKGLSVTHMFAQPKQMLWGAALPNLPRPSAPRQSAPVRGGMPPASRRRRADTALPASAVAQAWRVVIRIAKLMCSTRCKEYLIGEHHACSALQISHVTQPKRGTDHRADNPLGRRPGTQLNHCGFSSTEIGSCSRS